MLFSLEMLKVKSHYEAMKQLVAAGSLIELKKGIREESLLGYRCYAKHAHATDLDSSFHGEETEFPGLFTLFTNIHVLAT